MPNIITSLSLSTSVISSTFAIDVGGGLGDGEPFDITRQHFVTDRESFAVRAKSGSTSTGRRRAGTTAAAAGGGAGWSGGSQ